MNTEFETELLKLKEERKRIRHSESVLLEERGFQELSSGDIDKLRASWDTHHFVETKLLECIERLRNALIGKADVDCALDDTRISLDWILEEITTNRAKTADGRVA